MVNTLANPTFPNAYIDIQDNSATVAADPTNLPIHIPIFMSFAEKGVVGVPTLGGANALQAIFGSQMLNERSPLFTHQSAFLKRALPFQQVMFVRVADPAAVAASFVLLCTVTPGSIPQYQRNSSGALILTNGNPTPLLTGSTPVTQPGVTLSYSVRPLATGETLGTIVPTTSTTGSVTTTTYPLMAFQTTVGSAGNAAGFRLFYNPSYDTSVVANLGAMTYSFQPVVLNTLSNIESPIYDIYNNQTQTFSFMPNAYDSSTATYYSLQDVINNDYNGLAGLPYNFYVYGANVGIIGQDILTLSPELGSINPYLINILSGVDANGNTYEHMVVNSTGVEYLNQNVVNYLQGGTDGSLSNTMYESQVVAFTSGATYPQIADNFRYPCTHMYDSGFTLPTKEALCAFYALRDDVKISFSTQDVSLPANTAAQDQSTGSALRAIILLNPESIDLGTEFCRADIYQQCGKLSDTQIYQKIVPATINRMLTRCQYNGGLFVKGEPKGRPASEVTILNISSLNWTPTTPQQKQLSWNTGLNYLQFCDVNTIFYPDLLSVYPIDTSLLSSDCFVDYAAVYMKHIIRQQWTKFSGTTTPPKTLYKAIQQAIDQRASFVFGSLITTNTVVSQTAVDTALGYQITVTTTISGNFPNRVWRVIVPITRAS